MSKSKDLQPTLMWLVRGHTGRYEDYSMWVVGVLHYEDQAQAMCDHLNKCYLSKDLKTLQRYDPDFYEDGNVSYDIKSAPLKIWGIR